MRLGRGDGSEGVGTAEAGGVGIGGPGPRRRLVLGRRHEPGLGSHRARETRSREFEEVVVVVVVWDPTTTASTTINPKMGVEMWIPPAL